MQDRAGGHAPAKGIAATRESCSDEEAVAEVVEEVTDDHGTQESSFGPEFLCVVEARQLRARLSIRLHRLYDGRPASAHEQAGDGLHDGRHHDARQDHAAPSPHDVHLAAPAHRNVVGRLEEQEEEGAGEQSPGSKGEEHGTAYWLHDHPPQRPKHQHDSDEGDQVHQEGSEQGRGFHSGAGRFRRLLCLRWQLANWLDVFTRAVLQASRIHNSSQA